MSGDWVIDVRELRAGYRTGFSRRWREVLGGISFQVAAGSVTGYLGINGAGKTTTIKVLVGVNPPRGGQALILGEPCGSKPAQRGLGYFPEAPFFYDGLSAAELLDFFGRLHGLDRARRARRAAELLEEVGLASARDVLVREFSKGMRQRLGLAQALIHDPRLLVLDEPLDGLDPMGRLHLRELIAAQGRRGTTVFFSSHVLSDVEAVCDHLVILDGGQIAFQGPTAELSSDEAPVIDIQLGALDPGVLAEVTRLAKAEPSQLRGGGVHLTCVGQEVADRIVDAARASGARVLSLQPRRPTLEETFLERFGSGAARAPAPAAETAT